MYTLRTMAISASHAAVAAVFLLSATHLASADVGCRNAAGNPVDWWAAIKAPKLKNGVNPDGVQFIYVDSGTGTAGFKQGQDLSDTSGNPLAETVQQIYDNNGYVVWNDQIPGQTGPPPHTPHAHSKGVMSFDSNGGFYLLHSTPRFPADPEAGAHKSTGAYTGIGKPQLKLGQSYLCVTMDKANLNAVASVIAGEGIIVFGYNMAGITDLPEVEMMATSIVSGAPTVLPFQSLGGEKFKMFGMASGPPLYMFEGIIEPELQTGLRVQTFTEACRFHSYCPGMCEPPQENFPYDTLNIVTIAVPGTSLEWQAERELGTRSPAPGCEDHSKWALTVPGGPKVMCMADNNRAPTQLLDGGGAACFVDNDGIWGLFDSIIGSVEDCENPCPDFPDSHGQPSTCAVGSAPSLDSAADVNAE